MILMHMMVAGLLVLDESSLYTWQEMMLLFGSAAFVILGIYVLTCKQNLVVLKDQEDLIASGAGQTYYVSTD